MPTPAYSLAPSDGGSYSLFNFQDSVVSSVGTRDGREVLVLAKSDKPSTDTYWRIDGARFKVTEEAEYVVVLKLGGDLIAQGHVAPGATLEWFDAAGEPLKTVDVLGADTVQARKLTFPVKDGEKPFAETFSKGVVPLRAAFARIVMGSDHPNIDPGQRIEVLGVSYYEHRRGESWLFDDITGPELVMLTESPTADRQSPITFRLTDDSGVDLATFACQIDGCDVTARLERKGDVFTFRPSSPWAEGSVHSVRTVCSDTLGHSSTEWGFVCVSGTRVAHPRMSVRADGMLESDGRAFFPVGAYNVHACAPNGGDLSKAVSELKANGFNLALTYMVRGKRDEMSRHYGELVAACRSVGLLMLPEPAVRSGADRERMFADNAIDGRTNAGLLGWTLGDDTSKFQTPADLKRNYRFCRAIDPEALTFSVDGLADAATLVPYVPYADVHMLEIYPMRAETPEDDALAKYAKCLDAGWRAFEMSGRTGHSLVAVPQTFKGWGNWKRYPTREEIRAATFVSLVCRARGIAYYTYFATRGEGFMSTPERKAEMFEVSRELGTMAPSLALPDAEEQPKVEILSGPRANILGGASVRCLLKTDGLLVAANTSHLPVRARLTLPDGQKIVHDFPRNGVLRCGR